MKYFSVHELQSQAESIRAKLEQAFGPETALPGSIRPILSAGQCAAAAAIVFDTLGGLLVSATVENESHWFNRIAIDDAIFDLDITGDQFGRATIQIAPQGTLYEGTRVRQLSELNSETVERTKTLAKKAGFHELNLGQDA